MSVGSTSGVAAGLAGIANTQRGADASHGAQATAAQQRASQADARAESAAGIAETDGQSHDTNERDADGRRPWEIAGRAPSSKTDEAAPEAPLQSRDATGQSGGQLDLTG